MHTPYATPVPARVTWLARSIAAITTSVMFLWVFNVLGGVALSPKVTALGENDTGVIFNWHPLLMVLAFPVLMGEALLAYKAPILYGYASKSRANQKILHLTLHGIAVILVVLAVVAAVVSHTAKLPAPIPNLYSVHSWMGTATLALLATQVSIGLLAYVFPGWSLRGRKGLRPYHVFLGLSVYILGLATMAEKATFLQKGGSDVRSRVLVLPAFLGILLAGTGCLYLLHHAPASEPTAPTPLADQDALGGHAGSTLPRTV